MANALRARARALLNLLDDRLYDDAETTINTNSARLTLHEVDDEDRQLDTTLKHAHTLAGGDLAIGVQHDGDTATIKIQKRE
jgi:hypothetical protein